MKKDYKILFTLFSFFILTLVWPNTSFAQSFTAKESDNKTPVVNRLSFGVEVDPALFPKGISTGAYFGVETDLGAPYIALFNTVGVGYWQEERSHKVAPHEREYYHIRGTSLSYGIGARVFLGVRYVFLDLMVNSFFVFSKDTIKNKGPWGLALGAYMALGFNIPINTQWDFQISTGFGTINHYLAMQIRLGMQIKI